MSAEKTERAARTSLLLAVAMLEFLVLPHGFSYPLVPPPLPLEST